MSIRPCNIHLRLLLTLGSSSYLLVPLLVASLRSWSNWHHLGDLSKILWQTSTQLSSGLLIHTISNSTPINLTHAYLAQRSAPQETFAAKNTWVLKPCNYVCQTLTSPECAYMYECACMAMISWCMSHITHHLLGTSLLQTANLTGIHSFMSTTSGLTWWLAINLQHPIIKFVLI
jgi:hypothetical protein